MGLSRQEYWSGFPFPSPEDLTDPGIKPGSPALQADSLPTELLRNSQEIFKCMIYRCFCTYFLWILLNTIISGKKQNKTVLLCLFLLNVRAHYPSFVFFLKSSTVFYFSKTYGYVVYILCSNREITPFHLSENCSEIFVLIRTLSGSILSYSIS